MVKIPKKVNERLTKSVSQFSKILEGARARDVNESDTVTIVTDMLSEIFGYDKYTEVTSEQAIRGQFCDLAIKLDNEIKFIIEVKAIGLALKDNHLRQAINYGANEGVSWIVLTNGIHWSVYKIKFEKPIDYEQVVMLDFLEINPKRHEDIEKVFLLTKEAQAKEKSAIEEFHEFTKLVNRHTVGAVICSEPVVSVIRRELRKLSDGAKITMEEIEALLPDVIKRDVFESEDADKAKKMIHKALHSFF